MQIIKSFIKIIVKFIYIKMQLISYIFMYIYLSYQSATAVLIQFYLFYSFLNRCYNTVIVSSVVEQESVVEERHQHDHV